MKWLRTRGGAAGAITGVVWFLVSFELWARAHGGGFNPDSVAARPYLWQLILVPLLALLTAALMDGRPGRDPVFGFCLGMVLGPVAYLALLLPAGVGILLVAWGGWRLVR